MVAPETVNPKPKHKLGVGFNSSPKLSVIYGSIYIKQYKGYNFFSNSIPGKVRGFRGAGVGLLGRMSARVEADNATRSIWRGLGPTIRALSRSGFKVQNLGSSLK